MYRDKKGTEYPLVHLLTEKQEGYSPGWYFNDETAELHGPFRSLEETFSQLDRYVRWLHGEAYETDSSPLENETIQNRNTLPKERRRK